MCSVSVLLELDRDRDRECNRQALGQSPGLDYVALHSVTGVPRRSNNLDILYSIQLFTESSLQLPYTSR